MTIPNKYIKYILDEESSFELIKKSIDSIFIEFYKLTGLTGRVPTTTVWLSD